MLYAIGDLHLSLDGKKSMEVFNGWNNYIARIKENWENIVKENDTVILCGDISWGMSLKDSLEDFKFLNSLPGEKIMLKGNHDYWWATVKKMEEFFLENELFTLKILFNNSYEFDDIAICGSRGWIFENGEAFDDKIIAREAQRLDVSLSNAAKNCEKIAFLHYPPVYNNEISQHIIDVLLKHEVKRCYYGHIHSAGHRYAIEGEYLGIDFHLVSADYLGFTPKLIK